MRELSSTRKDALPVSFRRGRRQPDAEKSAFGHPRADDILQSFAHNSCGSIPLLGGVARSAGVVKNRRAVDCTAILIRDIPALSRARKLLQNVVLSRL